MAATREDMIRDIEREVEYTRSMIGKDRLDPRVMEAMRTVPREAFVPGNLKAHAFDNGPLPIGQGQTISQPYIVALMTDLLQLEKHHSVLEIGTGCGYQTAILSQLAGKVYTMEVIPELGRAAERRLKKMQYTNIEYRFASGFDGWEEHAPYDGIIVTAAASHIPRTLTNQLKNGGRLVIPVGQPYMAQELLLVEKDEEGELHVDDILGVAFVPLQETHA